jgi:ABC-type hemin transport system substrate-binding protein
MVARHGFDAWSPAAIPVAGDQAGIDYEALLRVAPTHVLMQWGERALPERLVELAAAQGWQVRSFPLLTLDEVARAADEVRDRVLAPSMTTDAAARMPRLSEELAAALRARPERARVGKVLLLAAVSPPAALGPGSYHHDMLIRLGGQSAAMDLGAYASLDVEDVIARAPGAIVLILPRAAGGERAGGSADRSARDALGPLALETIPAVRAGRVVLIDDSEGLVPGPGLLRVARELSAALDAWSTSAGESTPR